MSEIKDLWQARYLIGQFALRDLRIRYRQAALGSAWALFMPLLLVVTGVGLRSVIGRFSGQPVGLSTAAEIATKAVAWAFFAGAIQTSTHSLLSHAHLIGKVSFTRSAIPVAAIAGQMVDFFIGFALTVLLLGATGRFPNIHWIWVVPIVLILVAMTAGAALLLSCANLFFRDVKYIVSVLMSFGIFATPVYYTPQLVGPVAAEYIGLNPLSPLMLGLQRAMFDGRSLLVLESHTWSSGASVVVWNPGMLLYSALVAALLLVGGFTLFRRMSGLFAEWA